ncbi:MULTISPECIES: hypothetical protein [Marinobacter]|jgi:hypothetical protein|uniref:hypothetical protein n=1 Tax=Marinobacter TaxID=2742 RepID=UPI000C8FB039|nr:MULTISPECIES: hypothetical protein [Marinobacter]MAB50455.1 hypothetical protein [Marinobacter sp.]MCZ4286143.1 hypothetical protein [Marinobacter salarius]|tara:strand:+ start:1720 stop:2091 length:372 start_codon:yes stop_codon:yes gene_type:complete
MSEDIEFLNKELSRLRVEQAIESDPLKRLEFEKLIRRLRQLIAAAEVNKEGDNHAIQKSHTHDGPILSTRGEEECPPEAAQPATNGQFEQKSISLFKIAEGVIAGVLVVIVIWAIAHYLGVEL